MPKSKISEKDILKKDSYRSILNLLEEFELQKNEDGILERKGLTHGQLLYALKENSRYDKDMVKHFTITNLAGEKITLYELSVDKKFNGRYLAKKKIVKGCIKNSAQLNEKLKALIKRGWVESIGTSRYYRYRLTMKYLMDGKKREIKDIIDIWDPDSIIQKGSFNFVFREIFPELLKTKGKWTLCGIPKKILLNLSEEEKNLLHNWLEQIEMYLWKIMELKYDKMKMSPKEYIEKIQKLKKNEVLNQMIQDNNIGFYYTAHKNMMSN